ncbi:unnamed protein product [Brachionus calyciflorus]|uniref:FLYWCH-type domain-containing protein n=1 Tax=Brachionus calyciflorus TaxID=104777 RepID=A0A814LCF0_9BILA|nr:unnamed protein product [Brachionus calyciflorus]
MKKLADSDPINLNNNNNTSSNSESQKKPQTATQSSSSFASSAPSALVDYSDSESTCSIGNEFLNAESDMNHIQINTDFELETKNFQSDLEIYNEEDLDSEIETDKNSVLNEKTENLNPFFSFASRGCPKMYYDDQIYIKEKEFKDKIYWKCLISEPI